MSLNQKYEEYENFPFLHVRVTSVRLILDCINVFLDPQCIITQEDFQHKTLLPLLSIHKSRAGKRGEELRELSLNSEAAI